MAETFNIKDLAEDAIKIGGGFAVAGYMGRYVEEKYITNRVRIDSTLVEKVTAWAANNGPKIGAYFLARLAKQFDIAGAFAGSVAFDSVVRLENQGVNPLSITMYGYRVMAKEKANIQRLIQENSNLRNQLHNVTQNFTQKAMIAPVNTMSNKQSISKSTFGML